MKTYRVYYKDGNQRLFEARNMVILITTLARSTEYVEGNLVSDIIKIEEVCSE